MTIGTKDRLIECFFLLFLSTPWNFCHSCLENKLKRKRKKRRKIHIYKKKTGFFPLSLHTLQVRGRRIVAKQNWQAKHYFFFTSSSSFSIELWDCGRLVMGEREKRRFCKGLRLDMIFKLGIWEIRNSRDIYKLKLGLRYSDIRIRSLWPVSSWIAMLFMGRITHIRGSKLGGTRTKTNTNRWAVSKSIFEWHRVVIVYQLYTAQGEPKL